MTLCLAWKQNNEYYFASDSRLSNDGSIISDDANKIFNIKVEISGPVPSDTPMAEAPIVHQSSFGLCFAGSFLKW
jgi:hypothetical protein